MLKEPYTYYARLLRVIDGDTYVIEIDLGFSAKLEQVVRLYEVNTPETRGDERPLGLAAKKFVEELFHDSDEVFTVTTAKPKEKYGRYLASIRLYGKEGMHSFDLAGTIVGHGFGRWM